MNFVTIGVVLAMGTAAWAGGSNTAPSRTTSAAKKPATAVVRKTSTASRNKLAAKKPASSTAAAAAKRSAKAPVVRTSWRNRQATPTADRYREIQEALVARGYLASEDASGSWGSSSSDAMKRFQADQTLESTGKIDSLSLIALGLGPRHDAAVSVPRVVDGNLQPELGRN
jgi:hypothetical protein